MTNKPVIEVSGLTDREMIEVLALIASRDLLVMQEMDEYYQNGPSY